MSFYGVLQDTYDPEGPGDRPYLLGLDPIFRYSQELSAFYDPKFNLLFSSFIWKELDALFLPETTF